MARTKISEFSATPGNNTDIDGINIAEGCAPSGINDAIRELMAQLKDFQAGTAGDSFNGPVGTTTAAAGAFTTLSSTGNTTLGDAAGDTVTVNGTATFANANPTLSAGTANGVAYLNGSKVLTTGSALTFDGTNLGIGTSSPATKLNLGGTSDQSIQINGSGTAAYVGTSTSVAQISSNRNPTTGAIYDANRAVSYINLEASNGNGNIQFYTTATNNVNATERARIDSSGNLLVGTTSVVNSGFVNIVCDATSKTPISIKSSASAAAAYLIRFVNNSGTDVGAVQMNGSNNGLNYLTSSDYRLKENIQPMTGALAKVVALKPCTYTWKDCGASGQGFIAHELQEVVPECVSGEKDAVETYIDDEGNEQTKPKYQGIDTSHLVATLTAAIQELNAKVEAQAAEIAALKGQA